jgi:hypothetical protein
VIPQGEGVGQPVSLRIPKKLHDDIKRIAKETNNTLAATYVHMLRWSRDAYDNGKAAESQGNQAVRKK